MKYMLMLCVLAGTVCCHWKSQPVMYKKYKNIEFVHCGDFYDGRVYVKNIDRCSVDEIIEFAFCYTSQKNLEGLVIESEYYPSPSFWSGEKKGNILYKIQFEVVDISESSSKVVLQKEVAFALKKISDELIEVPENEYNIRYNCK